MLLEVKNLVSGYYSEVDIIKDASLYIEESKVACIIGPNGSGKSTLLKSIFGLLKPKSGIIYYKGEDIRGVKPHILTSKGITYIPQERCIFLDFTVYQNLKIATWSFRKDKGKVKKTLREVYELFPMLEIKSKDKASTLSGGQQRMLEFSRALILHSELMLVDEPTAGLAPKLALEVYQGLRKLKERGVTILLVDQNIKQAVSISDYFYVLSLGKITLGTKDRIKLNDLIREWLI